MTSARQDPTIGTPDGPATKKNRCAVTGEAAGLSGRMPGAQDNGPGLSSQESSRHCQPMELQHDSAESCELKDASTPSENAIPAMRRCDP